MSLRRSPHPRASERDPALTNPRHSKNAIAAGSPRASRDGACLSALRAPGRAGGRVALFLVLLALAWVAGCSSPRRGSIARGQELFKTCVPCHGDDARGKLDLRTPSIAGLPDWYLKAQLTKFAAGIRGVHPDDMDGHRMVPMARTLYQPGDVEAVAAYVATLRRVPVPGVLDGNVAAGQQRFTSVCIACHGPEAKGNMGLGAPPLAGQADWYLLAQLKKFKSGMRGIHPADVSGGQMHAIALTIPDTTAMRDVISYIRTLSH